MSSNRYDADYFLRGRQSGKSLYENYRWLPDLTLPMAQCIVDHCRIKAEDTILDFGCARGYTVRALRGLGYTAFGYDVSEWAIQNADEVVKEYVTCLPEIAFGRGMYDWVIAKDVLEHIEYIERTIGDLVLAVKKGIFIVVPLSMYEGTPYVIAEYEADMTHVQRRPLMNWARMFMKIGWSVEMSYRVPGIKDNWYKPGWERGNGFITARRIVE